MEPERSLPYSQAPATCCTMPPLETLPPPEIRVGECFTSGLFCLQRKHLAYEYFKNFVFHGEELLAPRPTPKLEDHPLSAVRDCLFNIFAATLHIAGRSSIRNLRTRHALLTGTHKHGFLYSAITLNCLVCNNVTINRGCTLSHFHTCLKHRMFL